MPSKRLTKDLKKQIVDSVRNTIFQARKEELETVNLALAEEVYNHICGGKAMVKKMNDMPNDFFDTANSIRINSYRQYNPTTAHWNSNTLYFPQGDVRRIPYIHRINISLSDITDDALKLKIENSSKVNEQFHKEINNAADKVSQLLASCTTIKKLKETWDNWEKYVQEDLLIDNVGTALIVQSRVVNSQIDCAMKEGGCGK